MTTPADNTAVSIIQDAYSDTGLLSEGESVNSEQIVSGLRKLTDLANMWQTQGIKLWLNEEVPITLTAGLATYLLSPTGNVVMAKPLRVISAYYKDTSAVRRPLTPLSWADYVTLSQVSQSGSINSYFVAKQQLALSVSFWYAPDATAALGSCQVLVQKQVTNPISVTETLNFPIEWRIALRWGLADEICTGQPQAIMDRCSQRAKAYRIALEDWDIEDGPVRLTPNRRG